MFNSYSISSKSNQIVSNHVNAVTGNITKTYARSFFIRFNLTSDVATKLLNHDPKLCVGREYHSEDDFRSRGYYTNVERKVHIIQMVVVGDMEILAEVMFKEDYEEVVGV